MWADTLLIVGISVFTALLGEGIQLLDINMYEFNKSVLLTGVTWILVYKTEKYQRLKAEIERQSKKRKLNESHFICRHRVNI